MSESSSDLVFQNIHRSGDFTDALPLLGYLPNRVAKIVLARQTPGVHDYRDVALMLHVMRRYLFDAIKDRQEWILNELRNDPTFVERVSRDYGELLCSWPLREVVAMQPFLAPVSVVAHYVTEEQTTGTLNLRVETVPKIAEARRLVRREAWSALDEITDFVIQEMLTAAEPLNADTSADVGVIDQAINTVFRRNKRRPADCAIVSDDWSKKLCATGDFKSAKPVESRSLMRIGTYKDKLAVYRSLMLPESTALLFCRPLSTLDATVVVSPYLICCFQHNSYRGATTIVMPESLVRL